MNPADRHVHTPDASFDGGDLDCGGGLLLLIRRHIAPLEPSSLLEILSTDSTVEVELPAWCRLTGNELVSWTRNGDRRSYLVSKGPFSGSSRGETHVPPTPQHRPVQVSVPESLPAPSPTQEIAALSVMGIGSWPRPGWMLRTMHEHLEGRLDGELLDSITSMIMQRVAALLPPDQRGVYSFAGAGLPSGEPLRGFPPTRE